MNWENLDDQYQKLYNDHCRNASLPNEKKTSAYNLLEKTLLYFIENPREFDDVTKHYLGWAMIFYQIKWYDSFFDNLNFIFADRSCFDLKRYKKKIRQVYNAKLY